MKYDYGSVRHQKNGFTIVELLIVVVVIAILAAITIVAYNGIQNRARQASVASDLSSAVKALEQYKTITGANNTYPSDLTAISALNASSGNTYNYFYNSASNTYCLESRAGAYVQSATNADITSKEVPCSENGLLGWWDLNDGPTDTLAIGNNGTVSGATATVGANGRNAGAYNFATGASQSISLPRPRPYTAVGGTNFSLSAWLKTSSTNGQRCIFSTAGSGDGIRFGHGTGRPYYLLGGSGNYKETTIGSTALLNDDQWHHLAMSFQFSGSGWLVTAFVDGVNVGTDSNTVPAIGPGTLALIGNMNSSAAGVLGGSVDDLRMFSRAITAGEASALFSEGAQ